MPDAIPYTAIDLDLTVRTVIGEADNQGPIGQAAVAWVVRNRSTWKPAAWWGDTPAVVCAKHAQFSCWLSAFPRLAYIKSLPASDPNYKAVENVVRRVFDGLTDDPTGSATHYQVIGTGARWSRNRPITAIIRDHEFYRLEPDE